MSKKLEIWKDIPNFEGMYQISNLGNVKSLERTVISKKGYTLKYKELNRKLVKNSMGYLYVTLSKNSYSMPYPVHWLVLETFVCKRPNKKSQARHLNDIRTDNRLKNLCWGTCKDNFKDRIKNNISNKGENHGKTNLKNENVIKIKTLAKLNKYSKIKIAKMCNTTPSTVYGILNAGNWSHIKA